MSAIDYDSMTDDELTAHGEAMATARRYGVDFVQYADDVIAVGNHRGWLAIDGKCAEMRDETDSTIILTDARRVPAEHHVLLVFDKAAYVARVDDGYLVSWSANGAEATETFTDPLAAVERAIQLQGEMQ